MAAYRETVYLREIPHKNILRAMDGRFLWKINAIYERLSVNDFNDASLLQQYYRGAVSLATKL